MFSTDQSLGNKKFDYSVFAAETGTGSGITNRDAVFTVETTG